MIESITKENYHMFDDMVSWRLTGKERSQQEMEANKSKEFTEAFSQLEYNNLYIYAANVDGRYVGWISLIYMPKVGRWNSGFIYVDELWTAPENRRRGIAEALMEKALELMQEVNAKGLRLYVGDDNIPAQSLYKKCCLEIKGKAVFMEGE